MNSKIRIPLCIFATLVVVPSIIFNGFAISQLWEWFIVPVFNLPLLTIAQALGFGLVICYLTHQAREEDFEEKVLNNSILLKKISYSIFKPVFALGFGWIIVQFI